MFRQSLAGVSVTCLLVAAMLFCLPNQALAKQSKNKSQKSGGQGHGNSHSNSKNNGNKNNGGGNSGYGDHHDHQNQRPNVGADNHDHDHFGNQSRGNSQINISPYGIGFGYSGRNFGFSDGGSNFYQPAYGNGYAYPGGAGYQYNSPGYQYAPYSSYYTPYAGIDPTFSYPPYSTDLSSLGGGAGYGYGMSPNNPMATPKLSFPIILTKAAAISSQQRAEAAFRAGRYSEAAELARQVVRLDQENGLAYLFSSQTQFAVGNYEQAATDLLAATSMLSGDKWGHVVTNFRAFYGHNDYVTQTEQLSQQLLRNPNDIAARVVRGFHYGSLGYPESASEDFLVALAVQPDNVLANRLMPVMGTGVPPVQPNQKLEEPVPPGTPPRINPLSLPSGEVGNDNSQRVIQLVPQEFASESTLELSEQTSQTVPSLKPPAQSYEELPPGTLQPPGSVLELGPDKK